MCSTWFSWLAPGTGRLGGMGRVLWQLWALVGWGWHFGLCCGRGRLCFVRGVWVGWCCTHWQGALCPRRAVILGGGVLVQLWVLWGGRGLTGSASFNSFQVLGRGGFGWVHGSGYGWGGWGVGYISLACLYCWLLVRGQVTVIGVCSRGRCALSVCIRVGGVVCLAFLLLAVTLRFSSLLLVFVVRWCNHVLRFGGGIILHLLHFPVYVGSLGSSECSFQSLWVHVLRIVYYSCGLLQLYCEFYGGHCTCWPEPLLAPVSTMGKLRLVVVVVQGAPQSNILESSLVWLPLLLVNSKSSLAALETLYLFVYLPLQFNLVQVVLSRLLGALTSRGDAQYCLKWGLCLPISVSEQNWVNVLGNNGSTSFTSRARASAIFEVFLHVSSIIWSSPTQSSMFSTWVLILKLL